MYFSNKYGRKILPTYKTKKKIDIWNKFETMIFLCKFKFEG